MDLQRIIKKASIIGAGTMGHGIAEIMAIHRFNVFLYDIKHQYLNAAKKRIITSLRILEKKGKTKESLENILQRISYTSDLPEAIKDADIVFEAVPEIREIKKEIFRKVEHYNKKGILATNTSYFDLNEFKDYLKHGERFIGMHFFNPVVLKKALEIIPQNTTTRHTIQICNYLGKELGKNPIICKSSPGFVVNRIQMAAQVLLCRAVEKEILKPADMDIKMRKMGLSQGAFEIMDFVGLDVVFHGMKYMSKKLNKEYNPPTWMEKLVKLEKLGRKTGEGIFIWKDGKPIITKGTKLDTSDVLEVLDLMCVQINEATKLLSQKIVKSKESIDLLIVEGTGNPMGLFRLLKSLGKKKVIESCRKCEKLVSSPLFKPTHYLKNWQNQ